MIRPAVAFLVAALPVAARNSAGSDTTWIAAGENVDLDVEAIEVTGG